MHIRTRSVAALLLATMVMALSTGAWSMPPAAHQKGALGPRFGGHAGLTAGEQDNMPLAETEALARLEGAPAARLVEAYEWDAEKRVLILHVPNGASLDFGPIAALLTGVTWQVAFDRFSAQSLRKAADQVARAGSIGGVPISWAGAKIDGSGLQVAIVAGAGSLDEARARSLIASITGSDFPVDFIYEASGAALADRQYHTEPYIGGALISTRSGGYLNTCSSGFSIVQDGVPYSRTAMLTADHCGGAGTQWLSGRYSDSPYFGTGQSTSSGGADIRMITGNVTYYGANFVGPPTSNSAVWIKGYSFPLVGQSVCMNGSQSGAVCSNTITNGPVSLNAHDSSGAVHTYTNAYRSV